MSELARLLERAPPGTHLTLQGTGSSGFIASDAGPSRKRTLVIPELSESDRVQLGTAQGQGADIQLHCRLSCHILTPGHTYAEKNVKPSRIFTAGPWKRLLKLWARRRAASASLTRSSMCRMAEAESQPRKRAAEHLGGRMGVLVRAKAGLCGRKHVESRCEFTDS